MFLLPDRVSQFNVSVYDSNTMSDSIMAAVTLKLGQIPANTDVPLQVMLFNISVYIQSTSIFSVKVSLN